MSTINSIRKKNSNNRQQAGVWAKTTIKCSRVATAKITKNTHTKATANRTHNLSSRDIKLKIRECAQWKVFVRQCLNKDIESHCTPTSAKYLWGLQFALDSRQLEFFVLCRGYACPIFNRSMVDMTRAWRMLDNEISMTPMPEEFNNFYVKVDFVTVCCLFCFSYFFL